ncbi:MAG: hypothetical protein JOY71_20415 [Acetobacteraceae bacterium]|nr:hypothetical protein [Acetobacteraceae bacterium]
MKTHRRPAGCVSIAQLHRAGELTAVWVPDAAHEAMRDLVRVRKAAVQGVLPARQHLQGILLRHGRIHRGARPGRARIGTGWRVNVSILWRMQTGLAGPATHGCLVAGCDQMTN